MSRRAQSGVTLVELVVAIVIIAMAAATIVGLLAFMSRNSAETMVQAQSASIANAYLNEVLDNPFDDVDDYDGRIDDGVVDAFGNAVPNLADYTVAIEVTTPGLGAIPNGDTHLVTITVTDPLGDVVKLGGFKARHP